MPTLTDPQLKEHVNNDPAVKPMIEEYFKLLTKEDIGNSPDITNKLDRLEEAIRDRVNKLIDKEE